MPIRELASSLDVAEQGRRMHDLCAELYPICRSITGDGVRRTLEILRRDLPIDVHEVPSGTQAFDWTVPAEWNIRDAYVLDAAGRRVIDFRRSNLHVVNYSTPVRERCSLAELKEHVFTLPDYPEWIPYRTSYYERQWGFCAAHTDFARLADGEYEVVIDSSLETGSLTYGECVIPGSERGEVLLSCHVCHPSLANDNLSGIALASFLGRALRGVPLRYSYRFVFVPGTIGSIVWLARNEQVLERIRHGLVLTGVGDSGPFTYKRSRRGAAEVDRVAEHVLRRSAPDARVVDFSPYGYDERQYCSPGFDLPVGRLGRTPHGEYAEYHTSADDLSFIEPQRLGEALRLTLDLIATLECNRFYRNTNPKCEPQLGRRGLYRTVGGNLDRQAVEMGLLWVLNLSDGGNDLLAIAERSGLAFGVIRSAADALVEHGLLDPVPEP